MRRLYVKRLFVGGPWHGRVEAVPSGTGNYVVTPDLVTYERWMFGAGGVGLEVMVTAGMSGGDVMRTICSRAGLEVEE